MDENIVRQLGYMLAEHTRVLGMVAENERKMLLMESQTYSVDDFFNAAANLETIARNV